MTAQQQFDALTVKKKVALLGRVFKALEYDTEGEPGVEWSSDTTQALGELFEMAGVKFTPPA